jgi:hypothetical protein
MGVGKGRPAGHDLLQATDGLAHKALRPQETAEIELRFDEIRLDAQGLDLLIAGVKTLEEVILARRSKGMSLLFIATEAKACQQLRLL